jgi:hypothetical protein
MRMPRSFVLAIAIACVALAGCATPDEGDSTPTESPTSARSFAVAPSPSALIGDVPQELIDALMEEMASDAGVDRSTVEILAAEAVTWSDGSLGCPQPGMAYTQALVPGYRVVLEVEGEQQHYHSDASGEFGLCENPAPGASGGG